MRNNTDGDGFLDGSDPRPLVEDSFPGVTDLHSPSENFLESVRFNVTDASGIASVEIEVYYAQDAAPTRVTPVKTGENTYEQWFDTSLGKIKAINITATDTNDNLIGLLIRAEEEGTQTNGFGGAQTMAIPVFVVLVLMLVATHAPRIASTVATRAPAVAQRVQLVATPEVVAAARAHVTAATIATVASTYTIQQVVPGKPTQQTTGGFDPNDIRWVEETTGVVQSVQLRQGDERSGYIKIQTLRDSEIMPQDIGRIVRQGTSSQWLDQDTAMIRFHGELRGRECWVRLEMDVAPNEPTIGVVSDLHEWCKAASPPGPKSALRMEDLLEEHWILNGRQRTDTLGGELLKKGRQEDTCLGDFSIRLVDATVGPESFAVTEVPLKFPCRAITIESVTGPAFARAEIDEAIASSAFKWVHAKYATSNLNWAAWYWGNFSLEGGARRTSNMNTTNRDHNASYSLAGVYGGDGQFNLNWSNGKRDLLATFPHGFTAGCVYGPWGWAYMATCHERVLAWAEKSIKYSTNATTKVGFAAFVASAVIAKLPKPAIYFELARSIDDFQFERRWPNGA